MHDQRPTSTPRRPLSTPLSTHLEYAPETVTPGQLTAARWMQRSILTCGVLPMTLGLLILLGYAVTGWYVLPFLGFFIMLPAGGLCVLTGLGTLLGWAIQEHRNARVLQRPYRFGFLVFAALLLLSNFAVAFGCAYVGQRLIDARMGPD